MGCDEAKMAASPRGRSKGWTNGAGVTQLLLRLFTYSGHTVVELTKSREVWLPFSSVWESRCLSSLTALRCWDAPTRNSPAIILLVHSAAIEGHYDMRWAAVPIIPSAAFYVLYPTWSHCLPNISTTYVRSWTAGYVFALVAPKPVKKRLGGLCLSQSQIWLESIALRTSTEQTGKHFPKSNPMIKSGRI